MKAATLPPATRQRGCRRRYRRFICVLIVALLILFHRPLLRAAGSGLVVDDAEVQVDVVVVLDGDGRCEQAATMLEDGSAQAVLLIPDRPTRLTEMGIIRTSHAAESQRLVELGVSPQQISIANGEFNGDWREFRILKQWLDLHPASRVVILRDRFQTRRARYILGQILGPQDLARVRIVGLPDRRQDESNWWLRREGWRMLFAGYLDLTYAVARGEDQREPVATPEEYEQQLVRQWQHHEP